MHGGGQEECEEQGQANNNVPRSRDSGVAGDVGGCEHRHRARPNTTRRGPRQGT